MIFRIQTWRACLRSGSPFLFRSLGQLIRENNKALDKTAVYIYNETTNNRQQKGITGYWMEVKVWIKGRIMVDISKIRKKIINEYPLPEQIEEDLIFYQIDKHRYLLFWDDMIKENHIDNILETILKKTSNSRFHRLRTFIIVGKTADTFKKEDLVHCYMDQTGTSKDTTVFVNFYLINEEEKQIFMEDSWIFPIGLGYKKIVRKIDGIVRSHIVF